MNKLSLACLLAVCAASPLMAEQVDSDSCPVFVLKRTGQTLAIEKIAIGANQVKVFTASPESGFIDIILPVGPGISGNLAKWSEGGALMARFKDGHLKVTNRSANGKEWARPPRKLDDLRRYDVRVSVTAADGIRKSFVILEYDRIISDEIGPVVDMFAGMVPMSEGDHTVCTDTYLHKLGSHVQGEAPLEYDRWPLVVAALPDGSKGTFIVDIGAGATVVSRSFLPASTGVKKAATVQYSSSGKKLLKYAPHGATGAVDTILGYATLPELRLGSIRFKDARVDVMEEIADFYGRPIAGIIGLDLLRRCDVLSISLTDKTGSSSKLEMKRAPSPNTADAIVLPLTFVNSHMMLDGKINNAPVSFIMDTGAPDIFVDAVAAKRIGLKLDSDSARTGRGLDGGRVKVNGASAASFTFGDEQFGPVRLQISALGCFATLRGNDQNTGLLGNVFFSKFKSIEFDFERRRVRFVK